ncbi:MAG: hypothetical protein KDB88_14295, partial [Flavobacteriales bacterium]|nr:hypothetical protein [Flavobacteriales bacterium]
MLQAHTSWTVKAADILRATLVVMSCCIAQAALAQHGAVLYRRVTVDVDQAPLSVVLDAIAREGSFKLSYNADALSTDSLVSLHVNDAFVERTLGVVLPAHIRPRVNGEHVILTDRSRDRTRHRIDGQVRDGRSGIPIARASIVELRRNNAVVADASGRFELELKGELNGAALLVGRVGYLDTVVFLHPDHGVLDITLTPKETLERLDPRCAFERCEVEDLGVARLLVPASNMDQAANLEFGGERTIQLSLVPGVSTNKEAAGAMVNRISINVLGGYARGVNGFEIGGGVNIDAWNVRGAQMAGLANLVGGQVQGAQIAGGINHAMRSLQGLQLSGLANVVWDTLAGVQIAGGANVAKGDMRGTQISGATNVAVSDIDGMQISFGANVAVGDVRKGQVSGALNYGRNVSGAQFSLGMNVALGAVGGGQVASALNYAGTVEGGQVTFGMNACSGTVKGGQVGALNFAVRAEGAQVGVLNLSDTISGTSFGLLSIALRGYHRAEMFATDVLPLNLQVRTGTRGFHNILGWSPSITDS